MARLPLLKIEDVSNITDDSYLVLLGVRSLDTNIPHPGCQSGKKAFAKT